MIINGKKMQIDTEKLQECIKESLEKNKNNIGDVVGCVIPIAEVSMDASIASIIRDQASNAFASEPEAGFNKKGLFSKAGASLDKTMTKIGERVANIFECSGSKEQISIFIIYGEMMLLEESGGLLSLESMLLSCMTGSELASYKEKFGAFDFYKNMYVKNSRCLEMYRGAEAADAKYKTEVIKNLLDEAYKNITAVSSGTKYVDARIFVARQFDVLAVNLIKLIKKGTDSESNLFTGDCDLMTVEALVIDNWGFTQLLKEYQHIGGQGPIRIVASHENMTAMGINQYQPDMDQSLEFMTDGEHDGDHDCVLSFYSYEALDLQRLLSLDVPHGENISNSFKAKYI